MQKCVRFRKQYTLRPGNLSSWQAGGGTHQPIWLLVVQVSIGGSWWIYPRSRLARGEDFPRRTIMYSKVITKESAWATTKAVPAGEGVYERELIKNKS